MPAWRGGGEMIGRVTLEQSTYAPPPARFEAGTANCRGNWFGFMRMAGQHWHGPRGTA